VLAAVHDCALRFFCRCAYPWGTGKRSCAATAHDCSWTATTWPSSSRTRAAIGALVRAHKRALAEGGELRLLLPASAAVLGVFAVTGIDRLIPTFTDLDQALEPAPPAARPRRPRRRPGPANVPARTGSRPSLALDPAWPEGQPVRCPATAGQGKDLQFGTRSTPSPPSLDARAAS
jgi:hypothetical protein